MMKNLKICSVLVAAVMGLSTFTFAACDGGQSSYPESTSTSESSGPETDISDISSYSTDTYTSLIYKAIDAIYTSATGYEFTAAYNLSLTKTGSTENYTADAVLKTLNDGENFNADGEATVTKTTTETKEIDENTFYTEEISEYTYYAGYVRGTDAYGTYTVTNEEGLTEEEYADLVYYFYDISDYKDYITKNTDGEENTYGGLISTVIAFIPTLLNDVESYLYFDIAARTFTITYDIGKALLNYAEDLQTLLTKITETAEAAAGYTVDEFLADSTVKEIIENYTADYTGEDIYYIASFIEEIVGNFTEEQSSTSAADAQLAVNSPVIPEGTASQTAYEYILTLIDSLGIGDTALNDEEITEYVNSISSVTEQVVSSLKEATMKMSLSVNYTTGSLCGFGFNVTDFSIDDCTAAIDMDITFKETTVQLADISGITCANV